MNKKEQRPKIKKVKTRITTDYRGHYVSVDLEFLSGGISCSSNFPCSHSPYFQSIKAKLEILKDRIELFNDKRVHKRIGTRYILV